MKFRIQKASDEDYESERDINSIQELLDFVKEVDNSVVIDVEVDKPTLIIYDYYLDNS